jgi:hypothetical protein
MIQIGGGRPGVLTKKFKLARDETDVGGGAGQATMGVLQQEKAGRPRNQQNSKKQKKIMPWNS